MNAPYAAELSPEEFIHKMGGGLTAAMSLLEEPHLMIHIANGYSAICEPRWYLAWELRSAKLVSSLRVVRQGFVVKYVLLKPL